MSSMGNVWGASRERGASIGVSQGKITVGRLTCKKRIRRRNLNWEWRKWSEGKIEGRVLESAVRKRKKKCPCCVVMEVWWMTSARLRWSSSTYSAESHPAIQVLVQRFVFFGSNERGDFVRNRNVADANWDNENERGENRVIIGKCLLMLSDSDNL